MGNDIVARLLRLSGLASEASYARAILNSVNGLTGAERLASIESRLARDAKSADTLLESYRQLIAGQNGG